MKLIAVVIPALILAAFCYGEESDLRHAVTNNGRFSVETTFRGSSAIMRTVREYATNGVPGKLLMRSYCVGGTMVVGESDEDGDGILETMSVFNASGEFEVFKRQKDGTVAPIESAELNKLKKSTEATTRFMRQTLKEGKFDPEKFSRFVEEKRRIEEETPPAPPSGKSPPKHEGNRREK